MPRARMTGRERLVEDHDDRPALRYVLAEEDLISIEAAYGNVQLKRLYSRS